jgi:hypothetical protein
MQVDHVDISELPLLNTDLEDDDGGGGFPPPVEAFRAKVRAADCFLFASPEYNYSISGEVPDRTRSAIPPPVTHQLSREREALNSQLHLCS